MYDAPTLVVDELERLAPEQGDIDADWDDVLARARRDRRPRRVPVTPLLVAAALAVAVPAVALSSARGLLGLGAPRPVLTSAVALVSAPVGNHFYGHLWHSRSTTDGTCIFSTFDHRPAARILPRLWRGGGSCSVKGRFRVSPA